MSHADYQASLELAVHDRPLPVLIMTAMQKARRPDQEKLRAVFPEIWVELTEWERCFGGLLAGERVVTEPPACAQMPPYTKAWTNSPTDTEGDQR